MMTAKSFYLYMTEACCLCDQAKQMLDQLGGDYLVRDIFPDPELMARYGAHIPVLYCVETTQSLFWPFEPTRVSLFLESGL